MTNYLWVAFPREGRLNQTGDSGFDQLLDALPPRPLSPAADETEIQIAIRLVAKTNAGPLASRIGPLLDVIAGMARDADATSGELHASWKDQEEPTTSDALDSAERPQL